MIARLSDRDGWNRISKQWWSLALPILIGVSPTSSAAQTAEPASRASSDSVTVIRAGTMIVGAGAPHKIQLFVIHFEVV